MKIYYYDVNILGVSGGYVYAVDDRNALENIETLLGSLNKIGLVYRWEGDFHRVVYESEISNQYYSERFS